jgi:putative SOS response-associated peptidase YedK
MCGRFDQHTLPYRYAGYVDALVRSTPDAPPPRFNVAPQSYAWVARTGRDGARELVPLLWGLVPYWAEDPKRGSRPVNARAETVATRPMFRQLIATRRCVIPVDGFYEWQVTPTGKQPHYVRLASGEPMLLAGLWDRWRHGDAPPIESFTILTTDATEPIARLHDRMPAVIAAKDLGRWLDVRGTDAAAARSLLEPARAPLAAHPVSRLVNAADNEGPELIASISPEATPWVGSSSPRKRGPSGV